MLGSDCYLGFGLWDLDVLVGLVLLTGSYGVSQIDEKCYKHYWYICIV